MFLRLNLATGDVVWQKDLKEVARRQRRCGALPVPHL
jgi:hypothetical protein